MKRNDFPIFFMKRSDRLIARLSNMFYAIRLARQVDGQLIMVWPELPSMYRDVDGPGYFLDHIFDLREHYASGGARQVVFFDSYAAFPRDIVYLDGPDSVDQRKTGFDRKYFLEQAPTVYSGHYVGYRFSDEQKSPAEYDEEVRQVYHSIPVNEVVGRILATARSKIGVDKYAVLHVRKGDVGDMLRKNLPLLSAGTVDPKILSLTLGHFLFRTAPFTFYYECIEKCIKEGLKVVFFSDSPETFDHFAKKFGPRHFVNPERLLRARYPIQKAFLDFNMMAGACRIISTGSTYAMFSATLGGSELINVCGMGTLEEREEFMIGEYAPELASDTALRKRLHAEMEALMAQRRPKPQPAPQPA